MALGTRVCKIHSVSHFAMILSLGCLGKHGQLGNNYECQYLIINLSNVKLYNYDYDLIEFLQHLLF